MKFNVVSETIETSYFNTSSKKFLLKNQIFQSIWIDYNFTLFIELNILMNFKQ